jgi:hypothetical protein
MRKILLFLGLVLAFGLTGCATTTPITQLKPVDSAVKLDFSGYNTIIVKTSTAEGVEISEDDLKRMNNRIIEALDKRYPGRFQLNSGAPEVLPADLVLEVRFTKFKKLGFWPGTPEIKADILLKKRGALLAAGVAHAVGEKAIYGGDIPAGPIRSWGLLLNPWWGQTLTEEKFAEKLSKSLPDGL